MIVSNVTTKALIFDLDGTIIDSSEGIINSAIDTIEILGLRPLSREFIKGCIGPPIGQSIGQKLGFTTELINSFNDVFREIYKNNHLFECVIYDGIIELLERVKIEGYLVGIATNKREDYTKILLERLGIDHYFDVVCAMDMMGVSTKEQIVNNCISKLGVKNDEILMVGDTVNDMDAATKCHINFVGVAYGFGFKIGDTLFDCDILPTINDLNEYIHHS